MSYTLRPTDEVNLEAECHTALPETHAGPPRSDMTEGRVQLRATLDVDLEEEAGEERARAVQAQPESARQHQRSTLPHARWRPSDVTGWLLLLVLVCGLWAYNTHLTRTARLVMAQTQVGQCVKEMDSLRVNLMCDLVAQGSLPQPGKPFDDVLRDTVRDPLNRRDTTKDAFGRPYQYSILYAPDGKQMGFRVVSAGPDGVFGTDDDLVVSFELPHE